jgi:HD-GYP domain-containing protein (c-di-GMP phosphodiesterase class II)
VEAPHYGHSSVRSEQEARLALLEEVARQVGTVSELAQLVEQITRMTQHTLRASASSVLLLDEEKQELFFRVAEGDAKSALKEVRINVGSSIAGWVARNGKPAIVNDVSKDPRHFKGIDKATGFETKAMMCAPLLVHRKVIGVLEVLNKVDGSEFTEQDLETLVSVASTAAIAIENTRLHHSLKQECKSTIKALAAAIDAKDPYTSGHSQHVMEYALLAGASLSLSSQDLEVLEYAGILHDVGKIGIPDSILGKPGKLTEDEYGIIKRHPVISASILDGVQFLEAARTLVLYHHERYDGRGYPDGLKGEEIPLGARILAVADSFDAITSSRPYRAAMSAQEAIDELHRCTGTQFCPVAVQAFLSGVEGLHQTQPHP